MGPGPAPTSGGSSGVDERVTDPTSDPQRPVDPDAAPEHIERLVRGTRAAEEVAASLIGRWPRTRLLHQYQLLDISDPGRTLLRTSGPALGRDFELLDPGSPEPTVVATSTELIASDRLPDAVLKDLLDGAEPLDRLLDRHGIDWDSQLIRTIAVPEPSPAVQVLRLLWLDCLIGAFISEEHRLDTGDLAAPGAAEPTP